MRNSFRSVIDPEITKLAEPDRGLRSGSYD